jgi:hypothetical protein
MLKALPLIIRPLVRFLVRHSILLPDMVEALKKVYLDVAIEELQKNGTEHSASKLSLMTGLHRKDIQRLLQKNEVERPTKNIAVRVIGTWRNKKFFQTTSGKPRILTVEGAQSEFVKLVQSVSVDVNPYSVLFELERTGFVKRTQHGVRLEKRLFNPGTDLKEGFSLLASDVDDLIMSVEENLLTQKDRVTPNLHVKTEYDNIPSTYMPQIQEWLLKEGSSFHQRARNYLSTFDRDINPTIADCGSNSRVAVGTFSITETLQNK